MPLKNPLDSEVLTTSEAARALGVSSKTIQSWANLGKLRCQQTANGTRFFKRADVEAYKRCKK